MMDSYFCTHGEQVSSRNYTNYNRFSREVLISYLDADLLIARNSMGEPEVLRRQVHYSFNMCT